MIRIRAMLADEVEAVAQLVARSFEEFIAPDYGEEGRATFREHNRPEKLAERHAGGAMTLVAEVDDELAGVLHLHRPAHIQLLFVATRFHRRGVARVLVEEALQRVREEEPDVGAVTINSSPFAVDAYLRMGFEEAGPEREMRGMIVTPMIRAL